MISKGYRGIKKFLRVQSMETKRKTLLALSLLLALASLFITNVHGKVSSSSGRQYHQQIRRLRSLKTSLLRRDSVTSTSSSAAPVLATAAHAPALAIPTVKANPSVYNVTSYGADPTGKEDSTCAIESAISDALNGPSNGFLINGIVNLGGARINLEGGNYLISRPLVLPASRGNFMIHGGTLKASDDFPTDGYLIELSDTSTTSQYNYEFVTLRDLVLDSSLRGGGILVINGLRISIDNCYLTHFTTNGIYVRGGHETYVMSTFLGQHITGGGDPRERNYTGTAINLAGNDNALTDVVVFSAAVGVMLSGQANMLSGVHCYNKGTYWGGVGIYISLPGLSQTRIVHSYLDYTGIVAEDPVQLDVSNSFFLGDAYILLKSIKGVINGVNIVDNQFAGTNHGVEIVQLDQSNGPFKQIDQVVIDRNNVLGMKLKSTVARGTIQGTGTSWTLDFNPILVFPDFVKFVQYTLSTSDGAFPNHVLRNVSNNKVLIESNVPVQATVHALVDQGQTYSL